MFVVNIKLSYKKILFICVFLGLVLAAIFEFGTGNTLAKNNDISNEALDYIVSTDNYILTLSKINENLEENVGKKIQIDGFVYKLDDMDKKFFVCGRYTEHENTTKVAGIICSLKDDIPLIENEWIKVTGTITQGEYNGTVPVILVENVEKIIAPANTYVSKIK